MVKIRLMRVGKRKQPSYRVVVADSRSARDGRIIESIGHYGPRADPSIVSIDTDRAVFWLRRGAQPSGQVKKLLAISGAWSEFKGEPAPGDSEATPAPTRRASSRSSRATPAASVEEDAGEDAPASEEAEASAT
ncbi:MAG: 30S ribosomal protein S16 [Actinomycetota bacterium]|nr:30S ribosomal protein S16 [Actinomycetota bacterium]